MNNTKDTVIDLSGKKRIFFCGIGGVSMSSLAFAAQKQGHTVGGSDRVESAVTEELKAAGIPVSVPQKEENIRRFSPDLTVYTLAVGEDNEEIRFAKANGIPLISRADFMGHLLASYGTRIGICGMHGKSTTTAMVNAVFSETDATVFCGAPMKDEGGRLYRLGSSDLGIFESCEYKDSFLAFHPTAVLCSNIDYDHVDYFRDMEQIYTSFRTFAKDAERLLWNADDEGCAACFGKRGITYGIRRPADFSAVGITCRRGKYAFDVETEGVTVGHIELSVPGHHNVYNALGAFSLGYLFGIPSGTLEKALSSFSGISRRTEFKGKVRGVDVYDDYAHHPAEIAATLSAFREMGYARIFVTFQSHTYSRTAELLPEFGKAFEGADRVFVTDIYPARETDTRGMSAQALAAAIGENAVAVGEKSKAASLMLESAGPDDVCIVMGAGNVDSVFTEMEFDG